LAGTEKGKKWPKQKSKKPKLGFSIFNKTLGLDLKGGGCGNKGGAKMNVSKSFN